MSAQLLVVDGDMLQFDPTFGHRMVTPTAPARIAGKGRASVGKKRICVVGDEKLVQVPAQYTVPGHTPGQGTITIAMLAADQQRPRSKSGAAMIVKGSQFIARFLPTVPAVNSSSGTPEPSAPSMGKGRFIVSQTFARAR
jgi:hypothetical protein